MPATSNKKAPPRLSPQEQIVSECLLNKKKCSVFFLYWNARKINVRVASRIEDRRMQQHVGVIVARINKKRRKFVIVPGGKAEPRTYKLTRRR